MEAYLEAIEELGWSIFNRGKLLAEQRIIPLAPGIHYTQRDKLTGISAFREKMAIVRFGGKALGVDEEFVSLFKAFEKECLGAGQQWIEHGGAPDEIIDPALFDYEAVVTRTGIPPILGDGQALATRDEIEARLLWVFENLKRKLEVSHGTA